MSNTRLKDIYEKERPEAMCRRKKNEAEAGHARSDKNHCPATQPTDQIPDDRTFNPSLKTRGTEKEGNRRAADRKISL